MENPAYTVSFSIDPDRQLYIHQTDPKNENLVVQTLKLQPAEIRMMLEVLTDYPEYSDCMLKELEKRNIARPNHSL